ncbi:hypothetical protein [Chryseobacterium sp.]|uniref:hypothetical protein n=1 Tax=Chryseobacterium sp. TaxID=1871047 RepID=UPI00289DB82C|nr:hypothetical protein [Chryseobacterium sp.]
MKFSFLLFLILICSCTAKKTAEYPSELQKYELTYNAITHKFNQEKPFLKEYYSDASGVKIIPEIYKVQNYAIYGSENFKNENSFSNSMIRKLSEKYTKSNWRKDHQYKTIPVSKLKNFHGPLQYIYFSEIRNDSLRAEILANPFTKYSMTKAEHYLIIFENNKIKSVQKSVSHYD